MGWCCLGKVCLGLCFSLLSLSFFNLPILLSPHSGFPQTSSPKVTSLVAFSIMFSFLKKKKIFDSCYFNGTLGDWGSKREFSFLCLEMEAYTFSRT